jgi:hypothetical protein
LKIIEELSTELVQSAPDCDRETINALVTALRLDGTPLALSIARVVELVGDDLVNPGIALPPLAMACATLVNSTDTRALEAARYEIETLLPMPDLDGRSPKFVVPDVPLASLKRRN